MAKIWFVKEGQNPTVGEPAAEKHMEWCITNLSYSRAQWLSPLNSPPSLGESTPLDNVRSGQHVVIEVENQDIAAVSGQGWKTGFYLLHNLSVEQANEKLRK